MGKSASTSGKEQERQRIIKNIGLFDDVLGQKMNKLKMRKLSIREKDSLMEYYVKRIGVFSYRFHFGLFKSNTADGHIRECLAMLNQIDSLLKRAHRLRDCINENDSALDFVKVDNALFRGEITKDNLSQFRVYRQNGRK